MAESLWNITVCLLVGEESEIGIKSRLLLLLFSGTNTTCVPASWLWLPPRLLSLSLLLMKLILYGKERKKRKTRGPRAAAIAVTPTSSSLSTHITLTHM